METNITKIPYSKSLAYITGIAIGDGNLSNPNGRAVRLRITCDSNYPLLIETISKSICELLPQNKVGIVNRAATYLDVSSYSNKWEIWLGWNAGGGSKYNQKVSVPTWIKRNKEYSIECLRGLFQTDGSIYLDRGYKMVNFTTVIPNLAKDVVEMVENLGFHPGLRKIKYNSQNKHSKYVVRLSKNTENFIKVIDLWKS